MSKALISFFQHGVMHKDIETLKSGLYIASNSLLSECII